MRPCFDVPLEEGAVFEVVRHVVLFRKVPLADGREGVAEEPPLKTQDD